MTSDPVHSSPWASAPDTSTEAARAAAEEVLHARDRARAARVIAACSHDLGDARLLLDMLGLDRDVIGAALTAPKGTGSVAA